MTHARSTRTPPAAGPAAGAPITGAPITGAPAARAPTAGPAAAGPPRLRVNPIACTGHGSCADLLPELVGLDEWGYPLLADGPVPPELQRRARRAVRDCPALALLLTAGPQPGRP